MESSSKLIRIILWLRNDLRMHDNAALYWAAKFTKKNTPNREILPVFSFDPRYFSKN
jgi:deoxyribodipyrimidine photolyase